MEFQGSPVSASLALRSHAFAVTCALYVGTLGIQTQVFLYMQQKLQQLSHLPSSLS